MEMSVNGFASKSSNCNGLYMSWNICEKLTKNSLLDLQYAILILNRPVTQNAAFMMNMWNKAKVRVTVDGGTRRWDTYISNLSKEIQQDAKMPELVTGDFDSITEEILEKYKSKGCKIIHTPDQDLTDFTKAIVQLNRYCKEENLQIDTVIVVGQTSGRMDQIMGNIQTMFLCKEKHLLPIKTNVYLMSDDTLSWLLYPGTHNIDIPEDIRKHKKPWCSLVPVGEKCEAVTTSGLKWNLVKAPLKFGDMVSSSNTYSGSPTVTITCSHIILWSMKVPSLIGPWVGERK